MLSEPLLTGRAEDGRDVPLLLWRAATPVLAISSAVLGGGIGACGWVVNASVPMSYDREDPAAHLGEIAAGLGLAGPGVGLLTGVDVADVVVAADGGVRLWATVGLGAPIQASAPAVAESPERAGTVNVVAWVPERLSPGALVNVGRHHHRGEDAGDSRPGLAATGTATDAVCVACPAGRTGSRVRRAAFPVG